MIEVRCEHPKFDMAMEILTQITEYPWATPFRLLCIDFNCGHRDVYKAIQELKLQYAIEVHNDRVEGGRVCYVQRKDWARVQRDASKYYEQVYGRNGTGN